MKISAKKMKFMLKRYMEFEQQHGSKALVDAVVEKARAFVDAHKSSKTQD